MKEVYLTEERANSFAGVNMYLVLLHKKILGTSVLYLVVVVVIIIGWSSYAML